MRTSIPALVLSFAAAACGGSVLPQVTGSGKVVTQPLAVEGAVKSVRAEGALAVEISSGGAASATVEGDDNVVPLVHAELTEGVLRLWTDRGWTSSNPLVVRIGGRTVASVYATGATKVTADVLRGDAVDIVVNGASAVEAGEVAAKRVKADARGSSKLRIAGKGVESLTLLAGDAATVAADVECADLSIAAQGAARVSGPKSKTAKVTAAGAPNVDLDASQTLHVDASGTASVRYGGKPEIGGVAGVATTVKPR